MKTVGNRSRRIGSLLILAGLLLLIVPLLQTLNIGKRNKSLFKKSSSDEIWLLYTPEFPTDLNPQQVVTATEKSLISLVFNRLFRISDTYEVEPELLERWKYIPEQQRYELELKKDIYFHNNERMTAKDVISSIHRWAEKAALDSELLLPIEGVSEFRSEKSKSISGISSEGDYSISIKLKTWVDGFIQSLASPRFVVQPSNPSKVRIGSGPFRVEKWEKNRASLVRHTKYFLGTPSIRKVQLELHSEDDAVACFNEGKIDSLLLYSINSLKNLNMENASSQLLQKHRTLSFVIPPVHPYLRKIENRKAIVNLLSKANLHDSCLPDVPKSNYFIPNGFIGSTQNTKPDFKDTNPSKIPITPEISLYTSDDRLGKCLTDTLRVSLRSSGITPISSSFHDLYKKFKQNSLDLWIEEFSFKSEDPIGTLSYFNSLSNEYLLIKPIPQLQTLFESLMTWQTPIEKAKTYQKIDQFLVDHAYLAPISYIRGYLVYRNNISDIRPNMTGVFSPRWESITRSPSSNQKDTR